MAGISKAVRRTGRATQDWQNQFAQAGVLQAADYTSDTPNWLNATTTGDSEWLEMRDANLLLVQVNLIAGSFTAKIQGSIDNGKTFFDLRAIDASTGALFATVTFSASGLFMYNYPLQFAKVNVSALTTGPTEFWFSTLRAGGGR